jgi:ribosomal protein L40E
MHLVLRDTHRTLFILLSNDRKGSSVFLIIGLIAVVALFNPISLGSSPQQGSAVIIQSGTTYTASAITTTTQLNLTQANVNASRNFLESSWKLSSAVAQASINSTDTTGETVSAVWSLGQSSIAEAQTITYDFEFATSAMTSGSSAPNITAFVGLTSSSHNGWYAQSRTPVYPNNTKTISIANIAGSYANGSSRKTLLLQAQQVTNAQANSSGGDSTTLFQQEYPGYAGDGVLHQYSIEIDLQSNSTIWIVDDTIIAISKLSFVPSTLVFIASAATPGDSAVATLEDPVQTALLPILSITSTSFTGQTSSGVQFQIGNLTNSLGQISSLQNQINHLNSQVGNLTSQNAQLQAKNSQWFSQWWFSIVWALLGATVGGFLFVSSARLRTGRKDSASESGVGSSCPNCGGRMPSDATFCGECGTTLRETKSVCPGCGEQMPPTSLYCGECGTQIPIRDPTLQNSAHTTTSEDVDENQETWR